MLKKLFLVAFVLVVIAGGVFLFVQNGSAKRESDLKTEAAFRGSIIDKALAVGHIEPKREIEVKSKIGGLVRKIYVEIGQKVKAGDLLFDIAPDPTPVELAEASRQVELADVQFSNFKREYGRQKALIEKQLISKQQFESKEAEFHESELRLKLATEKLALIESGHVQVANRKVESVIRSTIDGMVLTLEVEEGDPIVPLTTFQAGTSLMTLAYMDDLIFRGNVDEIDVGRLHTDLLVEIEVGALPDEKVYGSLTRISPKAHTEDGATLFEVEIAIDSQGTSFLRAGYSANASIIINRKEDILLVPERLVLMTDSTSSVEIQDTLGVVTNRYVKTGLSDGINIEIVEGVKEGELLVERPPKEITGD